MDKELYFYNRNEILKRKNSPYLFSNLEVAFETYNEIVKEYPNASFHEIGTSQ